MYRYLRSNQRYRQWVLNVAENFKGKLAVYDLDVWMSGPAILGAIAIPVLLTAISVAFFMLSCTRKSTRWKVAFLPSLFFGVLGLGVLTGTDELISVGVILLAAAPNWLGEIFRVKASSLGYQKLAISFFCHHLIALLILASMWANQNALIEYFLGPVWWGSFIVALLAFSFQIHRHPPTSQPSH